jgi:hypothetical protein
MLIPLSFLMLVLVGWDAAWQAAYPIGTRLVGSVAIGDSCIVGKWRAVKTSSSWAVGDDLRITVEGGAGAILTVSPIGLARVDYSASAPLAGSKDGDKVEGTYRGVETYQVKASKGRLKESDQDYSELSFTQAVNDGPKQRAGNFSPASSDIPYSCNAKTLVIGRDSYTRD